jgi:hypothetical protein
MKGGVVKELFIKQVVDIHHNTENVLCARHGSSCLSSQELGR